MATLAGSGASASTAFGDLTTGIQLVGIGSAGARSFGVLTELAPITLSAPLYTGIGGVLDPSIAWPYSAPTVGSTIFYDPPAIAVSSSGEISSISNDCSALLQFFDGTHWNLALVTLTPGFVGQGATGSLGFGDLSIGPPVAAALEGVGGSSAAAFGDLSTSILLEGQGQASAAAFGDLTTGIQFTGFAQASVSATGDLSAQIRIAGTGQASSRGFGTIRSLSADLVGAGGIQSSGFGTLSTRTQLGGIAAAGTSGFGTLNLPILQGVGYASSSAFGDLATGITFAGSGAALSSAFGSLATGPQLAGSAQAQASGFGSLTTAIHLAGYALANVSATGALTVAVQFAGIGQANATGSGALSTQIRLSGNAQARVSGFGDLTVNIALTESPHYLLKAAYHRRIVIGRLVLQLPLPYAEYTVRVGTKDTFGADWSAWLAQRWTRGASVAQGHAIRPSSPNGYQYACQTAGQSGASEPRWPTSLGATVQDGSVTWIAQGVDTTSLEATVTGVSVNVPSGVLMHSPSVLPNQEVGAQLDFANAQAGRDYTVIFLTQFSNGEQEPALIKIKVR